MEFVAIVAFVVVMFFAIINGVPAMVRHRRRQRMLTLREQWAERNGWDFATTDPAYVNRWRGDPFDRLGGYRKVFGRVTGTVDGSTFVVFDYQRVPTTSARGAYHSHATMTVWALQLPAQFGYVQVIAKAHDHYDKKRRVTTGNDQFDRRYRVITDDPASAASLLTPEIITLIQDFQFESLHVEGQLLISCQSKRISDPDRLEAALHHLAAVAARLLAPAQGQ